jgi:hypothetical protein
LKILILAATFLALSSLPGCSTIRELADNYGIPARAAKAVDRYCEEFPLDERLKNRDAVNALTEKGDAVVTCVGDP